MSELMQMDYEKVSTGPAFTLIYYAIEALAATTNPFLEAYRAFIKEHGALLDQDTRDTVEKFTAWARDQPRRLHPYAVRYAEELSQSLADDAEDDRRVTAEWSTVDGDGVDDGAV